MALRDESASVSLLNSGLGSLQERGIFLSRGVRKVCNLVNFSAKEVPGREAGESTRGSGFAWELTESPTSCPGPLA